MPLRLYEKRSKRQFGIAPIDAPPAPPAQIGTGAKSLGEQFGLFLAALGGPNGTQITIAAVNSNAGLTGWFVRRIHRN
jgi:hypothetical protein